MYSLNRYSAFWNRDSRSLTNIPASSPSPCPTTSTCANSFSCTGRTWRSLSRLNSVNRWYTCCVRDSRCMKERRVSCDSTMEPQRLRGTENVLLKDHRKAAKSAKALRKESKEVLEKSP